MMGVFVPVTEGRSGRPETAVGYVITERGCWEWIGHRGHNGYGRIRDGDRNKLAHRWMYEQARGPIPKGKVLDHVCRVRHCVNPDHLRVTTHHGNIHAPGSESPAALNAAKTHCLHGHEYSDANTYTNPEGQRECRKCRHEAGRRRYAANRERRREYTRAYRARKRAGVR